MKQLYLLSAAHRAIVSELRTLTESSRYGYRSGSGGAGKYRGGDGLVREIELLSDAQVTLLAERRKFPSYGLAGGDPGALGLATLVTRDGSFPLPGKFHISARKGDVIRIETPGGGGWGSKSS